MCTLFLALDCSLEYPLVLLENRDEFYQRKSKPLHRWSDFDLIAGRDDEKGGTWMGVNSKGDWGVVTNYRDLTKKQGGSLSRGHLIPELIGRQKSLQQAQQFLSQNASAYGPFNLLYQIEGKVFCFSSILQKNSKVAPGIHGLSNAFLNTPWYKVTKGKKRFRSLYSKLPTAKEKLFSLMQDTTLSPDEELPDTGLPHEKEKLVSSLFISSPDYGTHCTSLLTLNSNGIILFEERRIDKQFSVEIIET